MPDKTYNKTCRVNLPLETDRDYAENSANNKITNYVVTSFEPLLAFAFCGYTRCARNVTRLIFYLQNAHFFKHQCYPLQNSSLGQLHTYGDFVPTFGSSAGSFKPLWSSVCPLHSFGCLLKSRNDVLWGSLGRRTRSRELRSGEGGWERQECLLRSKLLWRRGQCDIGVVMMEHPFVCNVWSNKVKNFLSLWRTSL